jgi:chemotaxis protein MotB
MLIRKSILLLSLVIAASAASCTTRYQDMLRERDDRIRELSGDNARLRTENDELQRRPAAPVDAAATPKADDSSMLNEINREIGDGATARYIKGKLSIGVDSAVTFNSGSTALLDTSHKVLKRVASVLKTQFAGKRFYIEGHTDTDPIQKSKFNSNRHLSAMRADAVATFLIQQGVPASSIVIVGYGEHEPLDAKAKSANRRVEIVVSQ